MSQPWEEAWLREQWEQLTPEGRDATLRAALRTEPGTPTREGGPFQIAHASHPDLWHALAWAAADRATRAALDHERAADGRAPVPGSDPPVTLPDKHEQSRLTIHLEGAPLADALTLPPHRRTRAICLVEDVGERRRVHLVDPAHRLVVQAKTQRGSESARRAQGAGAVAVLERQGETVWLDRVEPLDTLLDRFAPSLVLSLPYTVADERAEAIATVVDRMSPGSGRLHLEVWHESDTTVEHLPTRVQAGPLLADALAGALHPFEMSCKTHLLEARAPPPPPPRGKGG